MSFEVTVTIEDSSIELFKEVFKKYQNRDPRPAEIQTMFEETLYIMANDELGSDEIQLADLLCDYTYITNENGEVL